MGTGSSFAITGVVKSDGSDVIVVLTALNEANARVKAELQGIIVTSIVRVTSPTTDQPQLLTSSSLVIEAHGVEATSGLQDKRPAVIHVTNGQATSASQHSSPLPERGRAVSASAKIRSSLGWLLAAVSTFGAVGTWFDPNHHRNPSIDAMLDGGDSLAIAGSIGVLVGSSFFAIVSLILGGSVYRSSRHEAGSSLMLVAALAILLNIVTQLQPS